MVSTEVSMKDGLQGAELMEARGNDAIVQRAFTDNLPRPDNHE